VAKQPASRQTTSLQDILHRRPTRFIGREAQLALFRENLELPVDDARKRFLFAIHGEGGVGKTHLLRRLLDMARERGARYAYADEQLYGVPETMAELAGQLGSQMQEFQGRYEVYARRRDELAHDPQAPLEAWSRLTRAAVKTGLHASKSAPGAPLADLADLVDREEAADATDQLRVYLSHKFTDSADVSLLLDPIEELTPHFVRGLATVAAQQKLALFLDSYERTGPILESWLLDVLGGRFGELPTKIVVAIAGRQPLDASRWSEYLHAIAAMPLEPFTEIETLQLLATKGVADRQVAKTITVLSGRSPVLVAMLAESPPPAAQAGDLSGTAVERFLTWQRDAARREAVMIAALPRGIDAQVLGVLAPGAEVPSTFDWLCGLPFVTPRAGRHAYHDVVRGELIRMQRAQSAEGWSEAHRRLAACHHTWREQLLVDDPDSPAVLHHELEEAYHKLCASPATLIDEAVELAVAAMKAGIATAGRWAEVLNDAGRDTDNDELRRWSDWLLAGVDEQRRDSYDLLTALLQEETLAPPTRADALVERGRLHYFADRAEQALADLNDAVQADPDHGDAHAWRGAALLRLDDREAALNDLTRAVQINPNDDFALAHRGETLRRMGRYDEAVADLSRAIEIKPDDAWKLAHRGEALRVMHRHEEAAADFTRAIDLEIDAWKLGRRGETYRVMERYSEAIADFTRAIDLEPDNAWALANRGVTFRSMDHHQQAVADLTRALAIAPDDTWALVNRGVTLRLMKRYSDAVADLSLAIELKPDDAWRLAVQEKTDLPMGRHEELVGRLTGEIAANPADAWKLARRGENYRFMERHADAIADFTRAIELSPGYDWALAQRGEVLRLTGEYDAALADFTRAIELEPEDPWMLAHRGETLRLMQRYPAAVADFTSAIELGSEEPWVLAHRGETHRLLARHDNAVADFTSAIELQPDEPWIVAHRGETYRLMARYPDAVADLTRAIELDPSYEWALARRGEAYRLTERYSDAVADLIRAMDFDARFESALAQRGEPVNASGG
jgi:tetratricopeptide (TPR) repeat protein